MEVRFPTNGVGRKAAVVTGAAAGIGWSFAELLAREGHDLVLIDRQAARVRERALALSARFGVRTHAIVQELAEPSAVDRIWTECEKLGWPIEILVNNAGFHHNTLFHRLEWPEIEANIRVLVTVVLELTHRFVRAMLPRGRGKIINVASISGLMPGGRRLATYAASKAFVVRFSEALGFELEGTGIQVSALCPGFTRTELFEACGLTDVRDSIPSFMWLTPERVAEEGYRAAIKGTPLLVNGSVYRIATGVAQVLPRRLVRERTRLWHRAAYGAEPARGHSHDQRRRAALVTGASSGIGASIAEQLASEGHDVVLVARRKELLEQRAQDLHERYGVHAYAIADDLSDARAPVRIRERCDALGCAIDVLVNNAGHAFSQRFHEASWPSIEAAFQLLAVAPVHLTHLFLPDMIARGEGRILQIASIAGFEPGSSRSSMYSSAKAFLIDFSESVRAELEGTGVGVSVVCPGFTRTEWEHSIDGAKVPDFLWLDSDLVAKEALAASRRGAALHIIGGAKYQLWAAALQVVPRRWMGRLLSRARGGR